MPESIFDIERQSSGGHILNEFLQESQQRRMVNPVGLGQQSFAQIGNSNWQFYVSDRDNIGIGSRVNYSDSCNCGALQLPVAVNVRIFN